MVKQFDVYLCESKTRQRPCLVLSPDEMNAHLPYVIVAPITTVERIFPCRVGVRLMMRTVLKSALKEKMGTLPEKTRLEIADILKQMFSI